MFLSLRTTDVDDNNARQATVFTGEENKVAERVLRRRRLANTPLPTTGYNRLLFSRQIIRVQSRRFDGYFR